MWRWREVVSSLVIGCVFAASASASFHFMQIEQVIGGVGGQTTAQAIQLRMRSVLQGQVQLARLWAWDAAGMNPVLIVDLSAPVANELTGDRVLIASPDFSDATTPTVVPDFVMTSLIPASYLPAGSLTFEDDFGTVYWRLSWGGSSYTGSHAGDLANDLNGNFGPAFAGPLPSADTRALRFGGTASARSTSNSTDYTLTDGAATFTNNARQPFTVTLPVVEGDLDGDRDVDLDDHAIFAGCLAGPGVGTVPPACASEEFAAGDRDTDDDLDLHDAAAFFRLFVPPPP